MRSSATIRNIGSLRPRGIQFGAGGINGIQGSRSRIIYAFNPNLAYPTTWSPSPRSTAPSSWVSPCSTRRRSTALLPMRSCSVRRSRAAERRRSLQPNRPPIPTSDRSRGAHRGCGRNLEPRIIPLLRELGIGLVPFSPLGRGFLTGAAKRAEEYPEGDFRRGDPRFKGENFDANMRAAGVVRNVAAALGATPGQIALAWILHKGNDMVPIPATKRRQYLEENIAAAGVELSTADIARLDAALPPEAVAGERYNDSMMAFVDR